MGLHLAAAMGAAAFLLLSSGNALAQWIDITDEAELRDIMTDRESTTTTPEGKVWNRALNKANGSSLAKDGSGRREWARDWMVKDGQICIQDHLSGWEGIWSCRRWQRNAAVPGSYRTIDSRPEGVPGNTPFEIPRILNTKVKPAPSHPRAPEKASG